MVKVFQALALVLPVSLVGACSRTVDACPEGMVREGDRCVTDDLAEPNEDDPAGHEQGPSASRPNPASREDDVWTEQDPKEGGVSSPNDTDLGEDAGSTFDAQPTVDASGATDAALGVDAHEDAGPDAGATPRDADTWDAERDADATSLDASDAEVTADAALSRDAREPHDARQDENDTTDANEAAVDSGEEDASVPPPPLCGESDLSRWRTFQTSGSLIQAIASCYASDPRCATGTCDLAACLRRAAGVGGCAACVAEETRCALAACTSACGSSDTSDACRACACQQGCIGGTSECGMGAVNTCRDCRGTTCRNMSLDPALIMVIVDTAT